MLQATRRTPRFEDVAASDVLRALMKSVMHD